MTQPQVQESEWAGRFRCSECGHGERLTAWAQSNVYGRLRPDGEVEESYSDQHTLFEESIECCDHLGGVVEAFIDGQWTRQEPCEWADDTYSCVGGTKTRYGASYGPCPACAGRGAMDVPVEVPA